MKFIKQIEEYKPLDDRDFNEKRVLTDYINKFSNNILTRENEFAHITSSGFIMNSELTKVLFIHHNIYNTWAWTGGHADGDTDLEYIAVKEALEETGLANIKLLFHEIASLDIIPVWPHYKRGKYVCAHMHLNAAYILIGDEKAPLKLNEAETSGVRWIPIEEIGSYSNEPYIIEIYNRLIKRAKEYKNSTDLFV